MATKHRWQTSVVNGIGDSKQRQQQQRLFRLGDWVETYAKKRSAKNETIAGPYRCTTCDRMYTTLHSLYRHWKTHAATIDRQSFRCTQYEWPSRDTSRSEVHTVRQNADATYACTECAKTYRSERTLKRHALFTHGKGRRRFECDTCDKTFASNYTLRRHVVLARCAGKPCERCTNASCKDDRKSVILRRVFAYVLSRAISAQ